MGSVSSINPGVANLLQTLSNLNLPVLSSPVVTSALEKAPVADIVQLSTSTSQLEGMDAMFGITDSSDTNTSGSQAVLEDLLTGSDGAAATSQPFSTAIGASSAADQLANYQTALQSTETQGLFDAGGIGDTSDALLDTLG